MSHEAIYQSLFVQGKGALRKELHECLRSGRAMRRAKAYTRSAAVGQGKLKNMVMISERPVEVEDRAVPGHWEGDLIMGKKMTSIATLVERQSRYVMLCKLPNGHGAEAVRIALAKRIATLPANLRRTLTWDQGKEMAEHVRFTIETGVQVYFCDPKSPWQRGTNETQTGCCANTCPSTRTSRCTHSSSSNAICTLTQWKASTNPRLDATISGVRRGCCVDPLSTQHIWGSAEQPGLPSVRALSYTDGRGAHLLGELVLLRSRLGCPRLEGQVTDGGATGACNECLW